MPRFLRKIVAGTMAKHDETSLDLCYVTPSIIATSGPSQTYPQRAYRNPLDRLVAFLDSRHGTGWAIWEFRAEGTGYPDEAVYNRIWHYPWPDHHPPPFKVVPLVLDSMRQWLGDVGDGEKGETQGANDAEEGTKQYPNHVVVVHCKAGKGRSGTMACSYLVSECGWPLQKALDRFTSQRMRPGFGNGITIPSQLRWLKYVDRWTRCGGRAKIPYLDRQVEVVEIHAWGLRHGVKLSVEGYVDEGKHTQVLYTFLNDERFVVEGDAPGGDGIIDMMSDMASTAVEDVVSRPSPALTPGAGQRNSNGTKELASNAYDDDSVIVLHSREDQGETSFCIEKSSRGQESRDRKNLSPGTPYSIPINTSKKTVAPGRFVAPDEPGGQLVYFRARTPIIVPTSDVNITLERRNNTAPFGLLGNSLSIVTAAAHVWFNTFFEGRGPEQDGNPNISGTFVIKWEELDGIKGSRQKGSRAVDQLAVVWRFPHKLQHK